MAGGQVLQPSDTAGKQEVCAEVFHSQDKAESVHTIQIITACQPAA